MKRFIPLVTALSIAAGGALGDENAPQSDAPINLDEACTLLSNSMKNSEWALQQALTNRDKFQKSAPEAAESMSRLAEMWQDNLQKTTETYKALCLDGPAVS